MWMQCSETLFQAFSAVVSSSYEAMTMPLGQIPPTMWSRGVGNNSEFLRLRPVKLPDFLLPSVYKLTNHGILLLVPFVKSKARPSW